MNVLTKTTKTLLLASGFASLCSCSEMAPPPNATFTPATPVFVTPKYVSSPNAANNVKLVTGSDPALEQAFSQYVKTGKAPNVTGEGFIVLAYSRSQQPIIKTMPFQETVISLEPGEKFTNVSSGDPQRWDYTVATSGQGLDAQQQILIKPHMPNIATNLVITTDRRMYNLRMVSSEQGTPTRNVQFWYPEKMMSEVNAITAKEANSGVIDTQSVVNVDKMNFGYNISSTGGGFWSTPPAWKPIQVFDDGTHTFIQFPANVPQDNLPAMWVIENGQQSVINYRSKQPYFVVDKLFKQAILVMGVGSDKQQVTITNTHYQ